ncbi:MAG TPA: hypothetical protein VJ831_13555, partial [Jatrophihabitantaceae bacterium]|nr:hypothetical protein [Jatrophihabitantaceae bacterium]
TATEKANVHDLISKNLVHPDDEVVVATARLVQVDATAGLHPDGMARVSPVVALCFSHRTVVIWGRKVGTTQWGVCHLTEVRRFGDTDLELRLRNPAEEWANYTLRFTSADLARDVAAKLTAARDAITAMTGLTGIAEDGISRREWAFFADLFDAGVSPNRRDFMRAIEAWTNVQISERRLALYLHLAAHDVAVRAVDGPATKEGLRDLSHAVADDWPQAIPYDQDEVHRTLLTVCELAEPGTETSGARNNFVLLGIIVALLDTDLDDLRSAASAWVHAHKNFMIQHDIYP